jgi:hypothetical protein
MEVGLFDGVTELGIFYGMNVLVHLMVGLFLWYDGIRAF